MPKRSRDWIHDQMVQVLNGETQVDKMSFHPREQNIRKTWPEQPGVYVRIVDERYVPILDERYQNAPRRVDPNQVMLMKIGMVGHTGVSKRGHKRFMYYYKFWPLPLAKALLVEKYLKKMTYNQAIFRDGKIELRLMRLAAMIELFDLAVMFSINELEERVGRLTNQVENERQKKERADRQKRDREIKAQKRQRKGEASLKDFVKSDVKVTTLRDRKYRKQETYNIYVTWCTVNNRTVLPQSVRHQSCNGRSFMRVFLEVVNATAPNGIKIEEENDGYNNYITHLEIKEIKEQ